MQSSAEFIQNQLDF